MNATATATGPLHPLRPTVFWPRTLTYAAGALLAVPDVTPAPAVYLFWAWMLTAPWLGRIRVSVSLHPLLRVLEDLLAPGLALVAGMPLLGVGAIAFVIMVGHLNVNGPRAALECGVAWLLLAVAATGFGPFALIGSPSGVVGAVLLMILFALAAAGLSHLQSMRLLAAREALACHAEDQAALARRLARYLPPPVHRATFEGAGEHRSRSRRRWLTVCFADLAGFTALTDSAESEEVVAMLDDFYTAMAESALAHGGTLDKFIGDAVMVFFGDPATEGRHAEARACIRMAADMQHRFAELHRRWRAAGVVRELDLRVGVHSGWCTVGDFGHGTRMAYTVIGATVNAASRLEAAARPGQVLLSRSTWLLLGDLGSHCRRIGPVQAKGFHRHIEAFAYLGPDAGGAPLALQADGVSVRIELATVNPEAARALLARAAAALPEGEESASRAALAGHAAARPLAARPPGHAASRPLPGSTLPG
mgnify:CR=1 FL=1